jgi:hypothetical protein
MREKTHTNEKGDKTMGQNNENMWGHVEPMMDELNAHLDLLRAGVLAQEAKERTLARVDYIINLVRG